MLQVHIFIKSASPALETLKALSVSARIFLLSLRKHAYSNILKILPPKNENF